jgi:hypothetical protein
MAASPILLVADDLAVIAAVKRALAREGYECILATNAADAVIAWGHSVPGLVLLQPSVESDRGHIVLEELKQHPDAALLRVVLLGESVPGFPWPVEPLPLDPAGFAQTIAEHYRAGSRADGWEVLEPQAPVGPPSSPAAPREAEPWRATRPRAPGLDEVGLEADDAALPESLAAPDDALSYDDEPVTPIGGVSARARAAADPRALASELPDLEAAMHAAVEAQALAVLEATVPAAPAKDEPPPAAPAPAANRAPPARRAEPLLERAERAMTESRDSGRDARARRDEAERRSAALWARAEHALARGRASAADGDRAEQDRAAALRRAEDAEARARAELAALAAQVEAAQASAAAQGADLAAARDEVEALRAQLDAARRRADDAEAAARDELRELEAQLDAARRRARDAEAAARDQVMELRAQLDAARRRVADADARAQAQRDQLEAQLSSAERRADEAEAHAQAAVPELRAQLDAALARAAALDAELAGLRSDQSSASARAAEAHENRERELTASVTSTARRLDEAEARRGEAEQRAAQLDGALATLRAELEGVREELAEVLSERDEAREEAADLSSRLEGEAASAQASAALLAQRSEALAEAATRAELAEQALGAARATAEASAQSLAEAVQARDEAREQRAADAGRLAALEADLGAATDARDALAAQLRTAQAELERARQDSAVLASAAEDVRAELDAKGREAEAAEARAALAQERADALEKKALAPLTLPGRRPLGVPRTGSLDLEGLAQLVGQLVLAQVDGRLELAIAGGTRLLWFKRGAVIAAESSLEHESLVDRARRDGLIDARHEAELRIVKRATPREQLDAMRARGVIRDVEAVPLVQRYTEQTALEAFTEPACTYRLADEAPPDAVLAAATPRATLPMLAEALRRAVSPDVLLERLGGGEAVPEATDVELDLRALGFSERERKMLSWVDGEATVEDLSLASGLTPDVAFRALLVAKLLGVVSLHLPEHPAPAVDADLDVRRLDAKYDEVQDADYFAILGLPRSAGADDVARAFQRLGGEFDPLRFSGHPDPALQQRAQVVYRLLEEAARALEDDRRRAEYARHLLD